LKPTPVAAYARSVLLQHWGISATKVQPIESYDDFNFFVESDPSDSEGGGKKYLLKFFNGVESTNSKLLEGYSAMLSHLRAHCPDLQFQIAYCPVFSGEAGATVAVRLFSWISGDTMSASGSTAALLHQEGVAIGKMSLALRGFDHPGLRRVQFWDGQHFRKHISPFSHLLEGEDGGLRQAVQGVLDTFEREVLPAADGFPKSCIMGDCNDANIIVTEVGEGAQRGIKGLIDFGDAVYSWGVLELA
ncbi:unnamed protein product, partial [Ectocarpus fasciculatus]